MSQQFVSKMLGELRPRRLLPSLTAGFVVGILAIIIQISFAALIFSGELSVFVQSGIGFTLFGALMIGIVTALASSYPGMIALPQDSPAAILALIAAAIASQMPPSATEESAFFTIMAAIVLTSLLTGAFSLALGYFKLGGLVRYIPYPVIGGFLAGTGWLLVRGAIGVMIDIPFSLSGLPALFQSGVLLKWLPGLIFAVLLLLVLRRYSHFLIVPTILLSAIVLFYLLAWMTGLSLSEAGSQGWLLGPFPQGSLWKPLSPTAFRQVEWTLVLQQIGNIGTIMIISVVSLLLNASGLELSVQQDIDLNRELSTTGLANLIAGSGGSPAGYATLSLSALGPRLGSNSRLIGLSAAALCSAMLFFGANLLSFFPKPVLGGLLLFLGLSFLVEWLYDAWFKLSKADYLIILLILVTMTNIGVLQGVGLGLALAVILFVVEYSHIEVVKHTLSGRNFHSNVERPRLHHQLLRQKGDWLYIVQLQGFIFFGTANKLFKQVHRRIKSPELQPPRFIVMDFHQVSGLDASAVLSFSKMKQLAQDREIVLVFTHLTPKMRFQLEREVFQEENETWQTSPDLDHGIEWCEDQIIHTIESLGLSARPKTAKQQLEEFLPRSGKVISLAELVAEEEAQDTMGKETPTSLSATSLTKFMQRMQVPGGYQLIRQGDPPQGLYFIEDGQVTVLLEEEDGSKVRIRTAGAGTVVGEMGLYLGSPTSASVITERTSKIYKLTADSLKQMEEENPDIAAAFHKFIAQLLSERLLSTTDSLQALLK